MIVSFGVGMESLHGGERTKTAARLDVDVGRVLDASASLAPFTPRFSWRTLQRGLRDYPDRCHDLIRQQLAEIHDIKSDSVLPGNGAAELFTWAARDAASSGISVSLSPGFADYVRALSCWDSQLIPVPISLDWTDCFPQLYPAEAVLQARASVLWICNPHNPTGQLWSRASLEPLLAHFSLVICDEAFLPLVPGGEQQSLIPLVAAHPNLVVVRSLTKLYAIAGLRLGYAVAHPERLQRWSSWRDPWPVNGLALAAADQLLAQPLRYRAWCRRVQRWVAEEGAWMQAKVAGLPGITSMPSAANYFLVRSEQSLVPLRERLEGQHLVLLRDCRSFVGLGDTWLRIGLQSRRNNRRIVLALHEELQRSPLA